jgi:hypothetical protein
MLRDTTVGGRLEPSFGHPFLRRKRQRLNTQESRSLRETTELAITVANSGGTVRARSGAARCGGRAAGSSPPSDTRSSTCRRKASRTASGARAAGERAIRAYVGIGGVPLLPLPTKVGRTARWVMVQRRLLFRFTGGYLRSGIDPGVISKRQVISCVRPSYGFSLYQHSKHSARLYD